MAKLKPGDKYLNVNLLGSINVAAFKNADKEKGDNRPDYKGDGIAIWIREKQEPKDQADLG